MSGDYRHVIVKPRDLEYNILYYTNKLNDLASSDLDMLEQKPLNLDANHLTNSKLLTFEKLTIIISVRILFYLFFINSKWLLISRRRRR